MFNLWNYSRMFVNRFLFFIIITSSIFIQAQSPAGINYQAAVRDSDGVLYDNHDLTVYFKLIILETSNVVWEETHNVQTNEFGVFNAIIGFGESTSLGSVSEFQDINWGEGSMFMKVDIDFDNEGPALPVIFGESQLLSVPYALHAHTSGNNHWSINNGSIEPNDNLSINLSSSDTHISSDLIVIGDTNSVTNFNSEINFFHDTNLIMQLVNGEINSYEQINSIDPINSSHLATKNYVDFRDDNVVLQMNTAFEENINFFQNQINTLDIQVSDLEENVNQNSEAYYILQDMLSTNDSNLQDQVDIISSILQTLEDNISTNILLQNQLDSMQNEINNLSITIQQLQEIIIEE